MTDKPVLLIVDDEKSILSSLKRVFIDEDFIIITAKSGEEGLQKLDQHEIDLVLSDQKMPEMSGIEFLKKVRINHPHILTILMTAQADIDNAVKAINEAGVYKFILKPWDKEALIITIKRAFELMKMTSERDALINKMKTQDILLQNLEKQYPGITKYD